MRLTPVLEPVEQVFRYLCEGDAKDAGGLWFTMMSERREGFKPIFSYRPPYVMAVRTSRSRAETDALMDWYADRAGITRLRRLATGEYPAGIPGRVSDEAALRR